MSVLLILGAIPGFFFASWLVMIMVGAFIAGPTTGIPPIGYWTSLLVTITLWMGITPLIAASLRKKGKC